MKGSDGLNPEIIGVIGIAVMLILIFCRMWVGFAMILVGFIGCWIIGGWSQIFNMAGSFGYASMANYSMSCLPAFVYLGCLIYHTNMGADIFAALRAWLAKLRGGLAIATVGACAVFSALCGDGPSTAVTIGKISFEEMKKYGYSEKLAACSSCAGGTIGPMIPPSIPFIIFGVMTEQSIGQLFMAGVVPGVTQAVFYVIAILIWCRIKPSIAPVAQPVPMRQKLKLSIGIAPILIILIIMFGGLFSGLFTPTEAGAFSVFATVIVSFAMRRLKKDNFYASTKDAILSSCMVFFIILGAFLFTRFIVLSNLALAAKTSLLYLNDVVGVPPLVIVLIIVVIYLIVGYFFDTLAAVLLTVPIIFPIVTALGFNPIWWGVITIRVMNAGMITPPFGVNIFATAKAVNVPVTTLYKGMWPFVIADVAHVVLLVLVPSISLWFPRLLGMMR